MFCEFGYPKQSGIAVKGKCFLSSGDVSSVLMALISWIRNWPPGLGLVRNGVLVLLVAVGGWSLTGSISLGGDEFSFRFEDNELPIAILSLPVMVGVVLVSIGVIVFWRYQKRLSSRIVMVMEVRGLRDAVADPLVPAVRQLVHGQLVPLKIDLRQRVTDGEIADPAAALDRLAALPVTLAQQKDGANLVDEEAIVVYGGLAPVPMTFLTGMLIDDEGSVIVMDWDRYNGRWRTLEASDDGQRFGPIDFDLASGSTMEVALVVSVSYRVRIEEVKNKLPETPIVELCLAEASSDRHWSEDKQVALSKQFFETVKTLKGLGVRRIHLFLAAPNSVVFRFGRTYDRRNLPEIVVYQYDQRASSSYPWGVKMPASGAALGKLVL